jgi:hypothetical protein
VKTTAEKRELLRRVREAVHLSNAVVRDVALQDAADYIESTLPPQRSPGEVFYAAYAKGFEEVGDQCMKWDELASRTRSGFEAAARFANIQPQDIE